MGLLPIIEALEECSEEDLDSNEISYISIFKSWGFCLKNGTDGGNTIRIDRDALNRMKQTMNSKIVKEKLRICKIGNLNPAKRPEVRKLIALKATNRITNPVFQMSMSGVFIKEWSRAKDAALHLSETRNSKNIHNIADSICKVCKGKRHYAYGYKWEYKFKG